jgi:hypothetical protein
MTELRYSAISCRPSGINSRGWKRSEVELFGVGECRVPKSFQNLRCNYGENYVINNEYQDLLETPQMLLVQQDTLLFHFRVLILYIIRKSQTFQKINTDEQSGIENLRLMLGAKPIRGLIDIHSGMIQRAIQSAEENRHGGGLLVVTRTPSRR